MATKQCQHCGEIKEETEFHWKWKDVERLKVCKMCRKQDSKRYRDGSLEKRLAYNKQYVAAHKEEVSEYMKKYHIEHIEEARSRYIRRADEIAMKFSEYYSKNKEKLAARKKEWSKHNHDKNNHYAKNHDALKRGATISDFTDKQWKEMIEEYNHCCAYCGVSCDLLEQDHIIPVSKGGNHTKSNIVPACKPCNSSKKNKLLDQWKRSPYYKEHCQSCTIGNK